MSNPAPDQTAAAKTEPYQAPMALRWLVRGDGTRVLQHAVEIGPYKLAWRDVREVIEE